MVCTQKNRAAKPYIHLPYQSLEELTAEKSCLAVTLTLRACREITSFGHGSALPSVSHQLCSQAGSTRTKAHPQQQAHHDTVSRACSKVTMGWGKLKPAGTQSNSVRDVILQSGDCFLNRQGGEKQEHLLQVGKWNICSANQAQKEHKSGQVEHWAPWMSHSGQCSCVIRFRSLFCDGQDTPLTCWHYRKLSPVFPSNPLQLHLCVVQKP